MTDLADVVRIYRGSDAMASIGLYAELEARGPAGKVAVNLLRACKKSERAKGYRPRSRRASYDGKEWALGQIVALLAEPTLGPPIAWGWGLDLRLQLDGDPHHHVLYVELPTGQVSFHTGSRLAGPEHARPWDGSARGSSAGRICRWAALLLGDASALDENRFPLSEPADPLVKEPEPVDAGQGDLFT